MTTSAEAPNAPRPRDGAATQSEAPKDKASKPAKPAAAGQVVPLVHAPQKRSAARARPRNSVRRLPAKLARSRDALLSYFRPIFTAHGLTDSQWRVLRVLSTTDEMDAGETAHRAFLLPSSLSRILRELSERGLIACWVPESDARRSMHALTKAGRKLVDDIEPHLALVHREIESRFGVDRVQALCDMLDAFSDEFET